MNNSEYILLASKCPDCGYECQGMITTVRSTKGGGFYLCNSNACTDKISQLEITEELYDSLLQQYIAVNGSTPVSP